MWLDVGMSVKDEPDGYQFGAFDFGLSPEQEERAQRLHRESIIIDLLYWGPMSYRAFDPSMQSQLQARFEVHRSPQAALIDAYQLPGRLALSDECPEMRRTWADSGVTGGQCPFLLASEAALLGTASYFNRIADRLEWIRKVDTARDFATTPVIASHSCAQGVYAHPRGKSDEELRAIAASGGVIGVVTVPFFLAKLEEASIGTWLDHVDYIADLVGWEHVGVGTDWPMAGPKWTMERLGDFASETGFDPDAHGTSGVTQNLAGFDDYRDFPNLTRGLVARGYSDEQVRAILGGNALRVFTEVLG